MAFKVGDRVQIANDTPYILDDNQRKGIVKNIVTATDGTPMYEVQADNYAVGAEEDNYLAFRAEYLKHTKK